MIISRTPYRISFFGGGTDYHTWYQEHGGAVLSTTIDHYCYLTCRKLPPFFEEKSRIIWSEIEKVNEHADIKHPAVRGVLDYLNIEHGIEISHSGDLPARSGLGSSSAFTVGLLSACYALMRQMSNKRQLACEAVHVERDILQENVGVQDQIATAYGGLNYITITPDGDFNVQPVIVSPERKEELERHCLLFFTGISRTASTVAKDKLAAIPKKQNELTMMRQLVEDALEVLTSTTDIKEFGRLLDETWRIKRSLATSISPQAVDDMYARARAAGAIGGKLLGAGGGGFMLFFAEPDKHAAILEALNDVLYVPFEFENQGSSIITYDPHSYSKTSLKRRDYQHLQTAQDTSKLIGNPSEPLLKLLKVNK